MGIFDGLSSSRGVSFGTHLATEGATPSSKKSEPNKIKTLANKSVVAKRATQLKKHNSAVGEAAKRRALAQESTIFKGMMHQDSFSKTNAPATFESKAAVASEIHAAKQVFMENLTNALFIGQVNIINYEACPIDERIKQYVPSDGTKPGYKEMTYEMCLSMFQDVRQNKDFDKVVQEGKVPGFVGELWMLARETAEVEANLRFNFDTIFESTGYDSEKLYSRMQSEINNLYVETESVNEYFQRQAALIIMENESVIDKIKGKVSAELDNYKETAQRIADIKKSVRTSLDDADSVEGTNGKPDETTEEEKPEGDGAGDTSASTSDENPDESGSENNEEKTPETSDQNDDKSNENEGKGNDEGTNPDDGNNPDSNDENGKNDKPVSNDDKSTEDKSSKSEKTTEESDVPGGASEEEPFGEISPKVTQEIEDAASFAEGWSHTFNTGDEKFETLRKRFSQELVTALNNNDLETVAKIRANVNTAKSRIQQLNESSDGKYSELLKNFEDLHSQIKFEYGRKVKSKVEVAEESRTIFESMVLSIAKRKIASGIVTLEDGNPEFSFEDSQHTINEALINHTALETFNTLRLIDPSNKVDLESTLKFFEEIRQ